ncbi:MAG: alpha/beta hydrolase [Gammaproteobacteria bacterium]|jgi:pimeloyl-ACP methyl ester carboxylesterase
MDGYTITLKDGRQLGFCEYGRPDGIPLMLFHGTPGSRIMPGLAKAAWVDEFGLRVITPERPGFGQSDPAPGRTIAAWATDVEELADSLGLDRYHVAGGSGGGPYALACAIGSAQRVLSATLISSGGPPEVMRTTKGMQFGNRVVFFGARYAPFFIRFLFAQMAKSIKKRPEKVLTKMVAHLAKTNESMRGDGAGKGLLKMLQEAYRQGGDGVYRDIRLVGRDWGLNLSTLRVPVFLWHGIEDDLVPVSTGRSLAELIPGCEAHFIPEAGHLLLGNAAVASQMMERVASIGA